MINSVNMKNNPILSICIPTYDRANLLKMAIGELIPQIIKFNNSVELIISDNCSIDGTNKVVENARRYCPIRYYKNNKNEGMARNIKKLCNIYATGEFGWIIGDDDLININGVEKVLYVIEKYRNVDYIFVNALLKTPEEREMTFLPNTRKDTLLRTKGKSLKDKKNIKFDELIDPVIDDVFLGAFMCSVFRLSVYKKFQLDDSLLNNFEYSLESAYSHTVVIANTMIGRNAYYIGYPCVIAFWGHQEWANSYLPLIVGVRLQELLDLYLNLGVDKNRIDRCRRFLLGYSQGALNRLLFDKTALGREYFSLKTFIKQNLNYKLKLLNMFNKSIKYMIIKNIPKSIYRFLKSLKKIIVAQ